MARTYRITVPDEIGAMVDRACTVARVKPRTLLVVSANAILTDGARTSIVMRAAEQRDGRDLARALESLRAAAGKTGGAKLSAHEARALLQALGHGV